MNRKRGALRWARYQYHRFHRLNDSPEKIAGGFALGVALGILPSFGLGIVIALFVAGALRVNRVSAVIGTLIMNPWTAPFFWGLSYLAGSLLLGYNMAETLDVIRGLKGHAELWENLLARRLLLPYVVGNVVVVAAASSIFYIGGLYSVRAYRRARARRRAGKTRMDY